MDEQLYDVAIIGGGVVGCSVLKELTSRGLKCVLCEQNANILSGASCGNSGTLHTGFDAPLDSLELECIKATWGVIEDFFIAYNVPYRISGALVVAWTEEDLNKLSAIEKHSHITGLTNVKQISVEELVEREPFLNPKALGALYVPGETIVDPWSFPASVACLGLSQGGTILTGCQVQGGTKMDGRWELSTSKGNVRAKLVINCAGLFGDQVEEINRTSPFTIKPRKGQFAVFEQSAQNLLNSIIFPVPTERTKGVLLFPSVYGNIVVGPTAEDQLDRKEAKINPAVIDKLIERAHFIVPALKNHKIIGTYAGLRPATEHKDYQIECLPERNWITVGGIRSTGLSACLGIAKYVASLLPPEFQGQGRSPGIEEEPTKMAGRIFNEQNETLTCGNQTWQVTHPITKFGISTTEGLTKFKSSLK